MTDASDQPDPLQGHTREWPSTPYSDEAREPEPANESACVIVLFGDCTVSCDQWPVSNRPDNHLRVRLRRAFAGQPFVVRNFAEAGGSAGDFLSSGRADEALASLGRLDVAFVRYGIMDRKTDGVAGCIDNLRALCERIKQAFGAATIIIETGMWVDFPAHYMWDRNSRLEPLYDAMRAFAAEAGHPLIDIFANTRAETVEGNWDLRVRGLPDIEHTIIDDSFDEFFGDDPAFYTNIHPNSRCMGLIAEWQVAKLTELFGDGLPGGRGT